MATRNLERTSARELLGAAYDSPGPYVSVYVPRHEATDEDSAPFRAFEQQRGRLVEGGATDAALDAIVARLAIPAPADAGGHGVIAASDGATVARFAPEGPAEPFVHVDGLPYSAPLLEWDQWRVPHLAVAVGDEGNEIIVFVPGVEPKTIPVIDPIDAAERCRSLAHEHRIELVVLAGAEAPARVLRQRLAGTLPLTTVISVVDADEIAKSGGLAAAVVRHVADRVARKTVSALRDFRFLQSHGAIVEGVDGVFAALADGRGGRLLVHDDPTDMRRAWFGSHATDVGLRAAPLLPSSARLVDVAIWSAIRAGLEVHVIPTTGDNGPAENLGLADDALVPPLSPATE